MIKKAERSRGKNWKPRGSPTHVAAGGMRSDLVDFQAYSADFVAGGDDFSIDVL